MKKGFTLVELSIVLVIIGLLIGGILVAQSMIQTARIQKLGTEMIQYQTMTRLYLNNYKFLPGDISGCSPDGHLGSWYDTSGSGIDQTGGGCVGGDYGNYWRDLRDIGYIKGEYGGGYFGFGALPGYTPIVDYFPKRNPPQGFFAIDATQMNPSAGTLYGKIGNIILTAGENGGNGFLTPAEAYAIDKKFDDSRPGTGEIVSLPINSCLTGNYSTPPDTINYNVSGSDDRCELAIFLEQLN